ncbi:MAG TPA: carboxymuconolactone decarboxylase family protein [Acidimicrobiales bacterium]|jgi:4-carboxymuconolactone decarboxylase|nr:carboxymuconolactone decarboxylase family protein [Acidimicrobiales bacterium]
MSELPLLSGDDDRLRAVQARAIEGFGQWPNLYAMLANAPDLLAAWVDFAWTLRAVPDSDRALRELAIMRVAQLTGSDYEWQAHWPMATEAGVPVEKLTTLAEWRNTGAFSTDERLVLGAAESLTNSSDLSDTERAQLVVAFGPQQTVELVLTIAFYSCVRRVLGGLGVPADQREEQAPGFDQLEHRGPNPSSDRAPDVNPSR